MKKPTLLIISLLVSILIVAQTGKKSKPGQTVLKPVQFAGIEGKVFDRQTGAALPARIVISDPTGNVVRTYYEHLPGFFTDDNGHFKELLSPGKYSIKVFHGIDYQSQTISFEITPGNGFNAEFYLRSWYPLRKKGWFCGDGHDHLYTDKKPDTAMLSTLRKICLAQGIDFVCAAQGWGGYNDSTWRKGYAQFTDKRFTLYYGSEMPKYRTGHTWWLGQKSTRGYFPDTMDTVYENNYYQSEQGVTWDFKKLNFPFIPDVEVVQRLKSADHSVAITAHPTSWWWQKRGEIEKYVTNAAVNLSFGLLAGKIWDGLVTMGYDHDHYFYQNLWFHILNEGYRMPAISELDGGFEKEDKNYYGSMRTYYKINGEFSVEKVTEAVRTGKTFITSGPIIISDVDKRYNVGDIVRSNGKTHQLHINAYASGEEGDYLSYVITYRNGRIFKIWDIRDKKLRVFNTRVDITERDKAWYIIKVYGKRAWKNPEHLDVMQVCEKTANGNAADTIKIQKDVAITSPFYFWPKEVTDPGTLQSRLNITVISPQLKQALDNVTIDILVNGKKINSINLKKGKGTFSMPVHGLLKISVKGYTPIYRSLYLDYPPHQKLLEELASGRWMDKYDSIKKFTPGEIPWEEFHFQKTKQMLSNVDWEIEMSPNERDGQWEPFNRIFKIDSSKHN